MGPWRSGSLSAHPDFEMTPSLSEDADYGAFGFLQILNFCYQFVQMLQCHGVSFRLSCLLSACAVTFREIVEINTRQSTAFGTAA